MQGIYSNKNEIMPYVLLSSLNRDCALIRIHRNQLLSGKTDFEKKTHEKYIPIQFK